MPSPKPKLETLYVQLPVAMLEHIDRERAKLGLTRRAFIEQFFNEKLLPKK